MKRFICLAIAVILLLSLCGCKSEANKTVSFYYCRKPDSYLYGKPNSVIVAEERDYSANLAYMLALYFSGPLDENLTIPLPSSCRLVSVKKEDTRVLVQLTGINDIQSQVDQSVAYACITLTCLELTGAESVVISTDKQSVTLDRSSILLFDENFSANTETGGQ